MQLSSNDPDVFSRVSHGSGGEEEKYSGFLLNVFLKLEFIIVVRLPPIRSNDYFLFVFMPTQTSAGNPCVVGVWFMRVLSVCSVNNIPRVKFLFVADSLNFLCCYWTHQQKREEC